jgi:hypothetical protein
MFFDEMNILGLVLFQDVKFIFKWYVSGKSTPLAKLKIIKILHELQLFHSHIFSASRNMDLRQIADSFLTGKLK